MSWNERIKAAREAQKLTREQTVQKMREYLPTYRIECRLNKWCRI